MVFTYPDPVPGSRFQLWNQPSNEHSGLLSAWSEAVRDGLFIASDFTVLHPLELQFIETPGFEYGASLWTATRIDWWIFADDDEFPAGQPTDDEDTSLWTFSSPLFVAGVGSPQGTILLDLEAADAGPPVLEPGRYWLMVMPTFPPEEYPDAWARFYSTEVEGLTAAGYWPAGNMPSWIRIGGDFALSLYGA